MLLPGMKWQHPNLNPGFAVRTLSLGIIGTLSQSLGREALHQHDYAGIN
jgi:hypothetical protein